MLSKLESAHIIWQGDAPFSTEFQDVYFSPAGGFDETLEVFVAGNGLPQRWQDKSRFTIAETGFGTGLNFLITLQQWAQHAPPDARLSYISIEKKPLTKNDLARALAAWPTLETQAQALLAHYPELAPGFHRRWFLNHRVALTLIFADVVEAFAAIRPGCVNAWYLDGFAPSRNPQMWQDGLFQRMAQLSVAGATYSTYTSAGAVRRGLAQAGFSVEKKPGFAGKRQRIQGQLLSPHAQEKTVPWFSLPASPASDEQRDTIVIGGGISGIAIADQLSRRGWGVTLLERQAQLALEGSGNLAGVVMPRLEAGMGISGQYFLAAFLHTVRWLDVLRERFDVSASWFKSGVVELSEASRLVRFAGYELPASVLQCVTADQASELCGVSVTQGGLYYPQAGYLDPATLIRALAGSLPALRVEVECDVVQLSYDDGQWLVRCANGQAYQAAHVVLANAYEASRLLGEEYLQLSHVRGQLSYLPEAALSVGLKMPIVAEGYVIPAHQGYYCAGATYHHGDDCAQLRAQDHVSNVLPIAEWLGQANLDPAALTGRVAWRAMTRDHLPCVGAAPDLAFYRSEYHDLKYGRRVSKYAHAQYQPGLWMMTGMGSRGLVSAPYCAELLADMMDDAPLCAPLAQAHALHPARRVVYELKRGR